MMEKMNRYEKLLDDGAYITAETKVEADNSILKRICVEALIKENKQNTFSSICFSNGIDESLRNKLKAAFGDVYKEDEEGYVIEADDKIRISSSSIRGLIYGSYTLQQMSKNGFVKKGLIYNLPLCSFRGLKVYLPAKHDLNFFKKFVDMGCYYRYNTIVLEVGGAMEYKRHPEINDGWIEYCRDMMEYSGKATKIQTGYNWEKNSIHCENGGGKWLTQAQVRELVSYCKERGLDVIPEIPCLSHCDYLLTRHPELAERQDDPYPDTYCPSNPASYMLLFDILNEVAEVFEPKTIHIGHDEYYTVGICEKCKDRVGAEIYADDIKKIHGYLADKGIATMMWSDKLINAIDKLGGFLGGAPRAIYHKEGGCVTYIPPIYPAIDLIPSNVRIMHWYWSIGRQYDTDYHKHGLELVFGNFEGPGVPDWEKRLAAGLSGASISNWSTVNEACLQRNGIFFNMAYISRMLWKEGYDESQYPQLAEEVFEELFNYKNRKVLEGPHIEITHYTTLERKFEWFFDGRFIEAEKDYLGEYEITFEDGTSITCPVLYGMNISGCNKWWYLKNHEYFDCYEFDLSLLEASYSSLPVRAGLKTFFKIVVENPYPDKRVVSVSFREKEGLDAHVVIQNVKVGRVS